MPQLQVSTLIAIGGTVANLFAGWQYEYLPWPARIKLLMRQDGAADARATVFSGSETIQEDSPVQGNGVIGTTPSELNTPPVVWDAAAGDRIKVAARNPGAVAHTIDAIIYAYPLR